MTTHGGKRQNSGRKPNSRNRLTQRLLREVVDEKDQKDILRSALKKAKEGDKDLVKFFLEHFHGKVPQDLNITHSFDDLISELESEE